MKFSDAYKEMRSGKKIKFPEWGGYWAWENDTIMIHTKEGEVLDIRKTNDVAYTFSYIIRDDWEVM